LKGGVEGAVVVEPEVAAEPMNDAKHGDWAGAL
jgi:hypothetical protein